MTREQFSLLPSLSSVLHVPSLSELKHLVTALSVFGGLPGLTNAPVELAKRAAQKVSRSNSNAMS